MSARHVLDGRGDEFQLLALRTHGLVDGSRLPVGGSRAAIVALKMHNQCVWLKSFKYWKIASISPEVRMMVGASGQPTRTDWLSMIKTMSVLRRRCTGAGPLISSRKTVTCRCRLPVPRVSRWERPA